LVRAHRERMGLTQTELAERSGLRQTYISQVEKGEIVQPRDHNLDALGRVLGLSRADFYRAAGMFEGLPDAPAPTQLTLSEPDEDFDAEQIVRYVEAKPGARFRADMAELRAMLPYPEYVRLCVSIFGAWSSNGNLAVTAVQLQQAR